RPSRRVIERWRATEADLPSRLEALLISYVKLIFSRRIRKVRDRFPVRRPSRIAVRGPGTLGDVSRVSLLRRHRKDFAVRFENSASAARRDARIQNVLRHLFPMWKQLRHIGRNGYVDRLILMRRKIVNMQRAELRIHD